MFDTQTQVWRRLTKYQRIQSFPLTVSVKQCVVFHKQDDLTRNIHTHTDLEEKIGPIFKTAYYKEIGTIFLSYQQLNLKLFKRDIIFPVCHLSCLIIKYFTVFPTCCLIKFYLQSRFLIPKQIFKHYMVYDSFIKRNIFKPKYIFSNS